MSETSSPAGEARIRRALWVSAGVAGVIALGVVVGLLLRGDRGVEAPVELDTAGPVLRPAPAISAPTIAFTDVTAQAGVDFQHTNGAYGERLLPETMGGGVAFLDYDNDGDQDLLLINSDTWPWRDSPAVPPTCRLYRNRGDGSFDDVSAAVGLDIRLYGMGTAVGDYDGDGFADVFITAVGHNRLMRNVAGERFEDVTASTGIAGAPDAWSTSAAFFDADGDDDLDLFVGNYVAWSPEIDRAVDFRLTGIGRAYGPPTDFPGAHSVLYRNDNGVFIEISEDAGIRVANPSTGAPVGKALAVQPVDLNDDGQLDLVVANDTVRNFVFVNLGDGRFEEVGISLGIAFDTTGSATGAMGIDTLRFADDTMVGIAIGNFANEMSSFYVARPGERVFSDDAIVSGIGAPSRRALTFGLAFLDADLDGRLDLVAANGHVEPEIGRVQASQRYAQPAQLFWNCGSECARRYLLADQTGDLAAPRIGRGLAYADIDADGDLDLAMTQAGGRAVVLRNDQTLGHHWIRLKLSADGANGGAVGAVLTLTTASATQSRSVMPSRSYLSQVELPVTFGIGAADVSQEVRVSWPNGGQDVWEGLTVDRLHLLTQGAGTGR